MGLSRLLAWRKFLRFKPFSQDSESGRNDERYRLALWSALANVISRLASMVVMILSIRLTLPYLGAERFGIWMTLASFVFMLQILDLGIGNALTNLVAKSKASAQSSDLAKVVSGGLATLLLVCIFATASLVCIALVLPWSVIIKVEHAVNNREAQQALSWFPYIFGLNLFGLGVQKVFVGLQRSFEAHIASAFFSLLSLLCLWLASNSQAGIPILLVVTLGCQSLGGLSLLFLLRRRGLLVAQGLINGVTTHRAVLFKTGGLFFVLQVGAVVGWGADGLIISSALGAGQVAMYSLCQRMFQLVGTPLALANAPLWSAYADAHSRGDFGFIATTFRRSLIGTCGLSVVGGLLLITVHEEIVRWLGKGVVTIPIELAWAFFIWTSLEAMGNSIAMMLNGCGIVKEQIFTVIVLTTLALPVKLFVIWQLGLPQMILAYALVFATVIGLFYGLIFRKTILNKLGLR